MNRFEVAGGRVEVFTVALKTRFITALGSKASTTNAGVRVRLAGGAEGYGEASGSVVMAQLKAGRLKRALAAGLGRLRGKDARYLSRHVREAWQGLAWAPPAAAALETALTHALASQLGVGLHEWFGGAVDRIETDLTISAAPAPEAAEAAARAASEGFRTLKIKVGTAKDEDLRRVLACWEVLASPARRETPRRTCLLDGNQGFRTAASALRFLEACLSAGVRVSLFEQPLARDDLAGMAWLARRSPVPIAADESVRGAAEALRVLDMGAADVINVKAAKTGLAASLDIIAVCRAHGKRLMIGCMQETAAGLSASVHLACGTGAFEFVDLDSDHLLAAHGRPGEFRRDGPLVAVAPRPRPRRRRTA